MITTNVIHRVFQLKFGNGTGTCFTVDVDNKQYFVTAKHVIEGLKSGDTVEMSYKNDWTKLTTRLIGHSDSSDISVFAANFCIKAHPLPPSAGNIAYGQDVYFLGFPYGLKSEVGKLNSHLPLPLVKKATLSALFWESDLLLLDGFNNPGFSGGPVVYQELGSKDFKVAGVISGYEAETQNVFIDNKPTDIQIRANTGIIISYRIETALDLIKQNPNGTEIPANVTS